MKITNKLIASLHPCIERHNNYLQHYKGIELKFDDFINSNKLTYGDKIWVARRVLNKNQLVHWALLCAQSVLPIFEQKYPNDKRPRKCIEYLITIKDFNKLTDKQIVEIGKVRQAVVAAAYAAVDADAAAATCAIDAAAYITYADAVNAATVAAYAIDAAAYTAYADAAYAAAADLQQEANLTFLKVAAELKNTLKD